MSPFHCKSVSHAIAAFVLAWLTITVVLFSALLCLAAIVSFVAWDARLFLGVSWWGAFRVSAVFGAVFGVGYARAVWNGDA